MPARESRRNLVISDRPDPVAVFVQPNRWIMRILFVSDDAVWERRVDSRWRELYTRLFGVSDLPLYFRLYK